MQAEWEKRTSAANVQYFSFSQVTAVCSFSWLEHAPDKVKQTQIEANAV